ncbi:hypothetical protein CKM354_000802600 [Cercospora kikuchii]|uniref:Uncharacterized protein n=1 Tax=Cercospora kikuchii TaxID=84275 RepID=A0A9P3CQM4_9PEZI|nr:uncharacterized protein CKM354_000802600 [Cercospora kikuchii]GIZ44840.1 hypothetical protein CKM354_000802600 [Cercospora kikuchii]
MFSLSWTSLTYFLLAITTLTSALPAQGDHQDHQEHQDHQDNNEKSAIKTVSDDLQRLNNDVIYLYYALLAFDGFDLLSASTKGPPIQTANDQLLYDLQIATQNAYYNPIGLTEALTIQSFVQNNLAPNIAATNQLLISKKGNFDTTGLSAVVLDNLGKLYQATQAYGQALQQANPGIVAQGVQQSLPQLTGPVVQAYQVFQDSSQFSFAKGAGFPPPPSRS